ncbi:hypothetical protein THAOC_12256 [Thalassiosira oceanica]|uniref:Uncharacterized protein n=1 Tax=Thalassiosira oceanica TaxID=159749 RepID=K0SN51_THAOC|nr:hypothetical protein THAOC_12256 [Thalassiosira oceanica]|eukprot:EJK66785.1 hypothetical protein THAOC_12256 [Thalassiosira oceanica]
MAVPRAHEPTSPRTPPPPPTANQCLIGAVTEAEPKPPTGSSFTDLSRWVPKAKKSTKPNATKHGKPDLRTMANIGRRCAMEVAEGCIPDQDCPPFTILASAEAVDPTITDIFGPEVELRSTPFNYTVTRTPPFETYGMKRQRSACGDITGFEFQRFSNGDLHAADLQVNSKYVVQMDVETLTDGLSPNIHRPTAIASIIRFACFRSMRTRPMP